MKLLIKTMVTAEGLEPEDAERVNAVTNAAIRKHGYGSCTTFHG